MLTNKSFKPLAFSSMCLALLFLSPSLHPAVGQDLVRSTSKDAKPTTAESVAQSGTSGPVASSGASSTAKETTSSTEDRLKALEQALQQQNAKVDQLEKNQDRLQKIIVAQQDTILVLAKKLNGQETDPPDTANAAPQPAKAGDPVKKDTPDSLAKADASQLKNESAVAKIGAIKIDGDMRLRAESGFGLSNNLANGDNPAVLGNELSPRHRFRLRARLKMSGSFGFGEEEGSWCKDYKCREFEWGLRLATGSFADNISTNQTFTDFFNRKPFALDQAYLSYRPKTFKGHLQLQGGKFEPPWNSWTSPTLKPAVSWPNSELIFDNDLMVEGFSESYTHTSWKSSLRELRFVAWQLPFLERNSAFVRNPDGTVDLDQSRRDGRDLALYGGQVRARFESADREKSCLKALGTKTREDELGKKPQIECPAKLGFDISVADFYFSGTQFISPVQVFGSQLFVPITFTIPGTPAIPATPTTPAIPATPPRTITTQASIPRDLFVAGNGNLGLTTASNNATNRDGRLSSGYNLVNVLARFDWKSSERWPVAFISNFVVNTQVHDVVTAGPGGANLILPNNERYGFWGEVQVGRAKEKGDWALGYTFMRIQKDAVLTPFNFSDVTQQSDMRGHRFQFAYTAVRGKWIESDKKRQDPRVLIAITSILVQRPNRVLGPFAVTPPGSITPTTTRLQFDTILRF